MTSRRYPRTTLEAWPTRYPHSVERYRRPLADAVASVLLACTIGAGLVLVLFYNLST
jgi:hypothetical protein